MFKTTKRKSCNAAAVHGKWDVSKLSKLAVAMSEIPLGTAHRWQSIGEMVGRLAEICYARWS